MRLLLTGASGFIGRHVLRAVPAEWEVHTVSRRGPRAGGTTWHSHDLLAAGPGAARALVQRIQPTHLLHAAWCAEPGAFWDSRDNPRWTTSSIELLTEFYDSGGRRAVVVGSCAEYDWSLGWCHEERTPLLPATAYGSAKAATFLQATALAASYGGELSWGRVFNVFGADEPAGKLMALVAASLDTGAPVVLRGPGQLRDYLHVNEVASALVHLLGSTVLGPVNIASGDPVTVGAFAAEVAALIGAPQPLVGEGGTDVPVLLADTRRIRGSGWSPQRTRGEALTKAANELSRDR